jgi:hypothetical protein
VEGLKDALRPLIMDETARRTAGRAALALRQSLPDWGDAARATAQAYQAARSGRSGR